MHPQIVYNRIVFAVLLGCGISLSLFIFKHPIESSAAPAKVIPALIPAQTKNIASLPVRLKIPRISVDAPIQPVGVTPKGAMDSPKGPADIGWFTLGPRPGERGSAVLDGHSGWKNGPAVFDNLYKMQKGDKIYVEDEMGVTTTFVVRELRTFKPKQDASSVFGSSDGGAHLNLITCTGFWNKILKSHSDRLIVFADKVE